MAHYILVHGAWHGGWCWDEVAAILRAQGHHVLAPDLPGHGKNKTPIKDISLEDYVERIVSLIGSQTEIILVGHSLGGMVISQAAERCYEQIKKLIYVAAFMPCAGESMSQIAQSEPPSRFVKMMKPDPLENIFHFPFKAMKAFAYHGCDESLFNGILPKFCQQPLAPLSDTVTLTEGRFMRIPKRYIECLQDRAIPISKQRRMYKRYDCEVKTLDCDHAPFYSATSALCSLLNL